MQRFATAIIMKSSLLLFLLLLKDNSISLRLYILLASNGTKEFDLGVIAKILGHRDISILVEVYGHILEEKIFEEFNQIRDVWKDCS